MPTNNPNILSTHKPMIPDYEISILKGGKDFTTKTILNGLYTLCQTLSPKP
jgi:hypothetical protein